jgi:hypothetical protein
MSGRRLDSLEFNPGAVRWDEPTDPAALCQKLLVLSALDQSEPTLGLSLFIRAHLPNEEARPSEAGHELLDLTRCSENHTWFAPTISMSGRDQRASVGSSGCL